MSHDMKSLFIKTFTQGVTDPFRRATIQDWQKVLFKYIREIQGGFHDIQIRPQNPK